MGINSLDYVCTVQHFENICTCRPITAHVPMPCQGEKGLCHIRKMYANETNINNFLAVKTPGQLANAMGSQAEKPIPWGGGCHKVTINLIK